MKKIFIKLAIPLFFLVFISAQKASALTPRVVTSPADEGTKMDIITDKEKTNKYIDLYEEAAKSEYALPYPGILPDHPLFFLKRLRDKILDMLIVDPLRKAEFYILQADKRLNMAIFLREKGKMIYVGKTVLEAEQFALQALDEIRNIKTGSKESTGGVVSSLDVSMTKHIDVLMDMLAIEQLDTVNAVQKALERVQSIKKSIKEL